jgi:hypothetical protein
MTGRTIRIIALVDSCPPASGRKTFPVEVRDGASWLVG